MMPSAPHSDDYTQKTILLVDDSSSKVHLLDLIEMELRERGLNVERATNARTAVAMIRTKIYAVVVTDWNMPDQRSSDAPKGRPVTYGEGAEVVAESIRRGIAVIVMSGRSEHVETYYEKKPAHERPMRIFRKPFNVPNFIEYVENMAYGRHI